MQNNDTDRVFLLIGTNLGDRFNNLLVARNLIEITAGKIIAASSVYETAAWGNSDQPSFFNQVLEIKTAVSPSKLLEQVLHIEHKMGRIRAEKWGPRLIDIDILLFGNRSIKSQALTLPHPHMHLRRFTLEPFAEIAADVLHPAFQKTISQLLEETPDLLPVKKISL